jgi:hypothetical protein
MDRTELPSEEPIEFGKGPERFVACTELISSLVGHRLHDHGLGRSGSGSEWLGDMIATVNLLQQRLRRPGRNDTVLQACLRDMADHWNEILKDRGIQVRAEAANHLRIDEAAVVTLAVIGQELLADAVAQAFQDERASQVSLRLVPAGPRACELSVIGEAEHVHRRGRRGRGPSLVHRLAESLHGRCEVESAGNGRGVLVRLALPDRGRPRAGSYDSALAPRNAAAARGHGPMPGHGRGAARRPGKADAARAEQ